MKEKVRSSLLIAVAFLFFSFPLGSTAYASGGITYTPKNTLSFDNTADTDGVDTRDLLCDASDCGNGAIFIHASNNTTTYVRNLSTDSLTLGTVYYTQIINGQNGHIYASSSFTYANPVAPAAGITLNPTQAYKINSGVASIPTAASKEVFTFIPKVMPYIILFAVLGVALWFVLGIIKKHGQPEEDSWQRETENSWIDHSDSIHDHVNSDH